MAKKESKQPKEMKIEIDLVQLKNSEVKLLLPQGYTKLQHKNPIKKIALNISNEFQGYQKIVETSNQIITFFKTDKEHSMNFDDLNGLVNGIHECLADNQGLIEAKNGVTKRGYKYIYSIVKTLNHEEHDMCYFLRLNIGQDNDILEVQGEFHEIGMTGIRDSMGVEFARRAGLLNGNGDNYLDGWREDPFDKNYNKGLLMNLSEREGIDALFPNHPLSQAREFLLSILEDEYVTQKEKSDEKEDNNDNPQNERDEKEWLLALFNNEYKRYTKTIDVEDELEKELKIDVQLKNAIDQYNIQYIQFNEAGTSLLLQREKAAELLSYIESLINTIANRPKTFDSDFEQIKANKEEFKSAIEFANEELKAAKNTATGSGAGIAAGAAVASMAPSAAMWIATTFGTASTGTAISTLSGAAATNAALAWLGGGALTAGGGGIAAGNALLALAGPVGWGIAGASILTSVALFTRKKIKLADEKNKELIDVKQNTASIRKMTETINVIGEEHIALYKKLNEGFSSNLKYANCNYKDLKEEDQLCLGALVNNAKSLSELLKKNIG